MSHQIDLTIYRRSQRHLLGKVIVEEDGSLTAQISRDHWPVVKELFDLNLVEFAIAPKPTHLRE